MTGDDDVCRTANQRPSDESEQQVSVQTARSRLLEMISPLTRVETRSLRGCRGRVVADSIRAKRTIPNHDRAAIDGWAVQSADMSDATDQQQHQLSIVGAHTDVDANPPSKAPIEEGTAVRVESQATLPSEADAVVHSKDVIINDGLLEISRTYERGENVITVGDDIESGSVIFESGHQLQSSDLGVLKSAAIDEVTLYQRPTVGIIPAGEQLVQTDPGPDERIETNTLTISGLLQQWDAIPTHRNVVRDDQPVLRAAIQRDLTKDVIVTVGDSVMTGANALSRVVRELGQILVRRVALNPGYQIALGVIEETPIVMLPSNPLDAIANSIVFLSPLVAHVGRFDQFDPPTTTGQLSQEISSSEGVRKLIQVQLTHPSHADSHPVVEPIDVTKMGVRSSVALTDGWIILPEEIERVSRGTEIDVYHWGVT